LDFAITRDPEAFNWLASRPDSVDHTSSPSGFDTDYDYSSDVWITSSSDQCSEMQIKVCAEL
jgi:hypothetical protein